MCHDDTIIYLHKLNVKIQLIKILFIFFSTLVKNISHDFLKILVYFRIFLYNKNIFTEISHL